MSEHFVLIVVVGRFCNSLQLLFVCVFGCLLLLGSRAGSVLVVHGATSRYACRLAWLYGKVLLRFFSIAPLFKAALKRKLNHLP
jgi:hypothetical protein